MPSLKMIEIIGFSSSISTLILFVAYIIGKCFVIKQLSQTISETVNLEYDNQIHNLRVIEEYNLGENMIEQIYLHSSDFLKSIKIYEYKYNHKKRLLL